MALFKIPKKGDPNTYLHKIKKEQNHKCLFCSTLICLNNKCMFLDCYKCYKHLYNKMFPIYSYDDKNDIVVGICDECYDKGLKLMFYKNRKICKDFKGVNFTYSLYLNKTYKQVKNHLSNYLPSEMIEKIFEFVGFKLVL